MRTIWYRHWLELRRVVVILCALAVVAALGYGLAVAGAAGYFARSGRLTNEIARYEALREMVPAPDLVPWAVHTLVVGFFALFATMLFQGTGIDAVDANTTAFSGRHPSVYFTASLPLSRERLVGSRLAAAVGGVAIVLFVSLLAHLLALLLIGQPIPFIAMTKTSLMGVVLALALIAVGAYVSLVVSQQIAGLVLFALTMGLWLTRDGWSGILQVVGGSSWSATVAIVGTSLLLVAAALRTLRRKEL